mgnify:CR=1 FL=1
MTKAKLPNHIVSIISEEHVDVVDREIKRKHNVKYHYTDAMHRIQKLSHSSIY